jgi:hypothetical protein
VVTNSFAAIQYIAAYVSKAEKELGEAMKAVIQGLPQGAGPQLRMRRIANAFANTRYTYFLIIVSLLNNDWLQEHVMPRGYSSLVRASTSEEEPLNSLALNGLP